MSKRNYMKPVNFRDLGGIAAAGGKTVAPKRLLRAGEIVGLTEDEKKILLEQYGLKNIIDLRSGLEVNERPLDEIPGVNYFHIDIFEDSEHMNSGQGNLTGSESAEDILKFMHGIYAFFVFDNGARKAYRRFIDILLNTPEGSSLFHCFAGKDRTGVAAAIILTLLGVSKEDIVKDYLKTNELRVAANEVEFERMRSSGAAAEAIEAAKIAMFVQDSFLENTFLEAEKLYGGFEAYVMEGIGVSSAEREKLQKMYLE